MLGRGATAAHQSLELWIKVRILAPHYFFMINKLCAAVQSFVYFNG